jgi:hypothetical protein
VSPDASARPSDQPSEDVAGRRLVAPLKLID